MIIQTVQEFDLDIQTFIFPLTDTNRYNQLQKLSELTSLPHDLLLEDIKSEKMEINTFLTTSGQRIFTLGLGEEPGSSLIIRAFRTLFFKNKTKISNCIGVNLSFIPASWAEYVINGILLASYDFGLYKTDVKTNAAWKDGRLQLLSYSELPIEKGRIIAETQLRLFELLNAPANYKTPLTLSRWAMQSANEYGYTVRVYDAGECQDLGLMALLAVGQGSKNEPAFIVLEYKGEGNCKKIGLVGKGVTFDTGGISIKPSENMHLMKSDMGGAAAVLGTIEAAARLQLPIHLIGIVPTTENSVDGESMKPGDVIPSYAGKTIEVTDTDAEGRLILADGLAYCIKNFQPDVLIDLATLTGSIIRTLGYQAAGLFTTNDELARSLEKAGEQTGERLWRLPMWEEYAEHLKSDIADVRNFSGLTHSQAIAAAKFLEIFTDKHPAWAHLDIAGTAYGDIEFAPQRAGTGYGIRLLLEYILNL
ncbi:MAG: leucyl aminopeptidase family protein [Siphonobacter sp.]